MVTIQVHQLYMYLRHYIKNPVFSAPTSLIIIYLILFSHSITQKSILTSKPNFSTLNTQNQILIPMLHIARIIDTKNEPLPRVTHLPFLQTIVSYICNMCFLLSLKFPRLLYLSYSLQKFLTF